MKKIIFTILVFSSFLGADIIHNVSFLGTKNKCIYNDYYSNDGSFYYRYLTSSSTWRSTTTKKYPNFIINGYQFDNNTSVCSPEAWRILGMDMEQFHFLNALIGILFGFVFMIFTIYLFMSVGGKR